MKKFLALSLSYVVFMMLTNVKMPTIFGILSFMSRINFVLSSVEHEKCFIPSRPVLLLSDIITKLERTQNNTRLRMHTHSRLKRETYYYCKDVIQKEMTLLLGRYMVGFVVTVPHLFHSL